MMNATLFTPLSSNRFEDMLENALWVNGFAKEREGLVNRGETEKKGFVERGEWTEGT